MNYKDQKNNYSKFSKAAFAFDSASLNKSLGTGRWTPLVSSPIHDISSSNSFSFASSWTRYILAIYDVRKIIQGEEKWETNILAASMTPSRVDSSASLSFSNSVFASWRPLPTAAPLYP
jgi:hypothetical protein